VELRRVGTSDLRVSVVGLGGDNFGGVRLDRERSRAVIERALDLGITLFDTADVYGAGDSETILGEVLGNRRAQVVVATKFGAPFGDRSGGAARAYVLRACEDSLRRLRTDWIDLYQVHVPDTATPLDETLAALDELVRQGKVRYLGLSNHASAQVADANRIARAAGSATVVACQDEYNLLVRGVERELIPAMQRFGLGLFAYFPLAAGLLTGKYQHGAPFPTGSRLHGIERFPFAQKYADAAMVARVEPLRAFCEARGRTLLELAFSWLAARPTVCCIPAGATSPEQVTANVEAARWHLEPEDLALVDRLTA
jgi:aryl-alcohol dehydrogenase-like predicted oxidoreductase